MSESWKASLSEFFSERARAGSDGSFANLCYVSGRDPRLWSEAKIYEDLISDICQRAGFSPVSRVLEVGCASGFLALGLTPKVSSYVGVDLSRDALRAATCLYLSNAEFKFADGEKLPFGDSVFDGAFSYDVFTNFADFALGAGIIREMLRVVRPGGRVLIGSIPDAAKREEYEKRIVTVASELDARYGPPPPGPEPKPAGLIDRIRNWLRPVNAVIVCYYFNRSDFLRLGEELGVAVELTDIHPLNPYVGFRFNAVYTKNAV